MERTATDEGPISPPPARSTGRFELPAYVSNGLIGLRIPEVPLLGGCAMVSGFSGEHPEKMIEAAAHAPFPLGGDLSVNGVRMSAAPHLIEAGEQVYDFACGELLTRCVFAVDGVRATVEVLIFCSRTAPSIVCQQIDVKVDQACRLTISGRILTAGIGGEARRVLKELPGGKRPVDGALRWSSAGDLSTCGFTYLTMLETAAESERSLDSNPDVLSTSYTMDAKAGLRLSLVQFAAVVPDCLHKQPELQAARLVAMNGELGFARLRDLNRAAWQELWKGRIVLVGAEPRWQAMADAAFFYLNTSAHPASPSSTSMFGLATWPNYHYYFGHVMWDIETFVVPVLSLVQPQAAAGLLEYRFRMLDGARKNARAYGRSGLQFPWESAPSSGDEAAPLPGTAAWHEDHVTPDVALAFAFHANVTGDADFLKTRTWPVLAGAANWLETRVTRTSRGYEIMHTMGIAERETPVDNAAFMVMSAKLVLEAAIQAGTSLGECVKAEWREIADGLILPRRGDAIISYDGYQDDDEKAETPDPLTALFPLGFPLSAESERATLALYLPKAPNYVGSPMLSALYGVWAARSGDRALASSLLDEGYAAFMADRFLQTLEYRSDRFPEQPMAGPFFANLGGFLMGLLLGFPALTPDPGDPGAWSRRPVVLPEGWQAIKVERLCVRGRPTRLLARQGSTAVLLDTAKD